MLAGVTLCWILFLRRAKRLGYSFYTIFAWLLLGLPVGTLGAHLFNKIIPALAGNGDGSHSFLGLTVIGSFISCLIYGYLYIKYVIKAPPMQLMDAVAFTFPLAILIGRIGCLLGGCCYGRIAPDSIKNSFLSVFTLPVNCYVPPSQAWQEYHDIPHDPLIWNLPLFLMINALAALVVTEYIYRKRGVFNLYPGTVFAATCTLYAGGRFVVEFTRQERIVADSMFNPWQLAIGLLFVISFLWLSFCLYRRKPSNPKA